MSESNRVEAFSDGVLAIALTLLVLDLHSDAARGEFGHELARQWPGYIAYLAAFLNIAAIWINHHDLFSRVHSVDTRTGSCGRTVNGSAMINSDFWPSGRGGSGRSLQQQLV